MVGLFKVSLLPLLPKWAESYGWAIRMEQVSILDFFVLFSGRNCISFHPTVASVTFASVLVDMYEPARRHAASPVVALASAPVSGAAGLVLHADGSIALL